MGIAWCVLTFGPLIVFPYQQYGDLQKSIPKCTSSNLVCFPRVDFLGHTVFNFLLVLTKHKLSIASVLCTAECLKPGTQPLVNGGVHRRRLEVPHLLRAVQTVG